jgi:hypothetical protein
MRDFIRKILKEELNSREVILFNKLNSKKNELKVKKNIIEFIEDLTKYLGLDPKMAQYYYLLWKSNYRKEGDYGNIPPEEFIGQKKLPQRTISNTQSNKFVRAKAPFKGSNLEGRWGTDKNGVDYYVVISYNWYPVYLFKQDKWYKSSYTYSPSTSRQMSNADPLGYDDNIERDFTWVTKAEMDTLMYGTATYDDIMKGKVKNIVKKKEDFINKKPKFAKNWGWGNDYTPMKARFKVTDIREEGGKAVVDVTIDDAGTREKKPSRWNAGEMETTNRMVPSEGGYLRGEVEGITKEKIENMIKTYIINNFKDYVGKYPNYDNDAFDLETTPEKHAIKFNFIHSKA